MYVLAQTKAVELNLHEQLDLSGLTITDTIRVLIGAHLANLMVGYLVLRSDATPVNIVSVPLKRVIDGMNDGGPNTKIQCAIAMGIIGSKLFLLETIKSTSSILYNDEIFKSISLTIALSMLLEMTVNGSIMAHKILSERYGDILSDLESASNIFNY